jgi:hypothetical protein
MARLTEWNKAVKTAFKMGRSSNKNYSLKNAMFDAKKIYKKGESVVLSVGRKSRGKRHRNNRRTRRGGEPEQQQQQQQQNGGVPLGPPEKQDGGNPLANMNPLNLLQKQQQGGDPKQQQQQGGKRRKKNCKK